MLYNNDVMHKIVIKFIITHIKIKILLPPPKKRETILRKYYIHPLCGSTKFKKGSSIHKFSNLDLSKGVTPLNVVLPKP